MATQRICNREKRKLVNDVFLIQLFWCAFCHQLTELQNVLQSGFYRTTKSTFLMRFMYGWINHSRFWLCCIFFFHAQRSLKCLRCSKIRANCVCFHPVFFPIWVEQIYPFVWVNLDVNIEVIWPHAATVQFAWGRNARNKSFSKEVKLSSWKPAKCTLFLPSQTALPAQQ